MNPLFSLRMMMLLIPSVVAFSSLGTTTTHRYPIRTSLTTTIHAVVRQSRQTPASSAFASLSFFESLPILLSSHHHHHNGKRNIIKLSSSWNDFAYDDDDDDEIIISSGLPALVDKDFIPADENDDPSIKAAAGMALAAPTVDYFGPTIQVPQGSELELDEDTVQGVLAACRQEIGTMFGYQAENRGVGITGGVDFVELDGPTVVLRLKGRFWHQRPTVLKRVGAYLIARIPEIVDVVVDDEYELTDEANNLAI